MSFFGYLKAAWNEAKEQRKKDKLKQRLLDKEMDYAYLEELVQKMNENPKLRIVITLTDGTKIDLNTTPKYNPLDYIAPSEEYMEVR